MSDLNLINVSIESENKLDSVFDIEGNQLMNTIDENQVVQQEVNMPVLEEQNSFNNETQHGDELNLIYTEFGEGIALVKTNTDTIHNDPNQSLKHFQSESFHNFKQSAQQNSSKYNEHINSDNVFEEQNVQETFDSYIDLLEGENNHQVYNFSAMQNDSDNQNLPTSLFQNNQQHNEIIHHSSNTEKTSQAKNQLKNNLTNQTNEPRQENQSVDLNLLIVYYESRYTKKLFRDLYQNMQKNNCPNREELKQTYNELTGITSQIFEKWKKEKLNANKQHKCKCGEYDGKDLQKHMEVSHNNNPKWIWEVNPSNKIGRPAQ